MEELRKENAELKRCIKQLTVQRERLEDQLFRAFRKCLNTKKRKIQGLQEELAALRGEEVDQDVSPVKRRTMIKMEENSDSSDGTSVDSEVNFEDLEEPVERTAELTQLRQTSSKSEEEKVVTKVEIPEVDATPAESDGDATPEFEDPGSPAQGSRTQNDDVYDLDDLTKDL